MRQNLCDIACATRDRMSCTVAVGATTTRRVLRGVAVVLSWQCEVECALKAEWITNYLVVAVGAATARRVLGAVAVVLFMGV